MPDRVSVILIVRNGARFIAEALDSVREQTLRPLEVLVIDGHSTDRTVEIARAYGDVMIISQTSSGIANAYNEGIACARGELLAFISHDDRWLPDKLERQVASFADHPALLLSVTHVQHVLSEGSSLPPGFRAELLDQAVPGFIMETLMVRREVFAQVGVFDPAFAVGEDIDWFARVKDAKLPMAVLPEMLVVKHVHETNASLVHAGTNALLLRALRGSIARKRSAAGGS